MYYKVGQVLLQNEANSRYHKERQSLLQSGAALLQSRTSIITKRVSFELIQSWRELLQSGAGNLLQSGYVVTK